LKRFSFISKSFALHNIISEEGLDSRSGGVLGFTGERGGLALCKLTYKQARGLVSKETMVLRRWGRETQNFGFIN